VLNQVQHRSGLTAKAQREVNIAKVFKFNHFQTILQEKIKGYSLEYPHYIYNQHQCILHLVSCIMIQDAGYKIQDQDNLF
jgi:hypothetical protein